MQGLLVWHLILLKLTYLSLGLANCKEAMYRADEVICGVLGSVPRGVISFIGFDYELTGIDVSSVILLL